MKFSSRENSFLSNMYPCTIVDKNGLTWRSAEHAYQAMKYSNPDEQEVVRNLPTAWDAKKYKGKSLRPNWESMKVEVMKKIVLAKFSQNKDLLNQLIATDSQPLVEDADITKSSFWGQFSDGKGSNKLGDILMTVRFEIGYKYIDQDNFNEQIEGLDISDKEFQTLNLALDEMLEIKGYYVPITLIEKYNLNCD